MTTVAYRDGVMAADSLAATEDGLIVGQVTKVFRGPKGQLVGAAGNSSECAALRRWVKDGCKPKKLPKPKNDFEGLYVDEQGLVHYMDENGMSQIMTEQAAIGSGRELAMAAMLCGKTAKQAVNVAIGLDVFSGGEVTVLKAQENPKG